MHWKAESDLDEFIELRQIWLLALKLRKQTSCTYWLDERWFENNRVREMSQILRFWYIPIQYSAMSIPIESGETQHTAVKAMKAFEQIVNRQ